MRLHPATWVLASIVLLAAGLRFALLADVPLNPFYEAAIRSMGMNWHNLFYGSLDPLGLTSIDKPPLHLWLQVASVKLFGAHHVSSLLPQATLGTLAVPLLYATIRRPFGRPAGLAAALFLAVLPVSVVTARSDTMDAAMMFLLVAAAWMVVRSTEGRTGFFYASMAIVGLAFNVKLFEALPALPGLVAMYLYGGPATLLRRAAHSIAGLVVFAGVAFSWVVAASSWPGHHPWPVGAARPSIWNAIFVFDGSSRAGTSAASGSHGLMRLFSSGQPFAQLVGVELLAALLIGLLAAGVALAPRAAADSARARTGVVIGFALWLLTGVLLLGHVQYLYARYLEAFTPAIAGVLGVAVTWLAAQIPGRRSAAAALSVGVGLTLGYAIKLAASRSGLSVLVVAVGEAMIGLAVLGAIATAGSRSSARQSMTRFASPLAAVCAIVAIAIVPAGVALRLVTTHRQSSGLFGRLHNGSVGQLSRFLTTHRRHARYELAVDEISNAAALIAHDGLPVLPLSVWGPRQYTSVDALRTQVLAGTVRYLYLRSQCPGHPRTPQCLPAARWAAAHGIEVTASAGLRHPSRLYELTRAAAR